MIVTAAEGRRGSTRMERRKRQRVAVELRCYSTTPKIPKTKLAATVKDLSRSGVRFRLDRETSAWEPFQIGDATSVEVALPAEHGFGDRCIFGRGKVVRVDQNGSGCMEVAVHFEHADFRELRRSRGAVGLQMISALRM